MDKAQKAFQKLPLEMQMRFAILFRRIEEGDLRGLHVKKLKGHKLLFRVRVGEWRVVFEVTAAGNSIIDFSRRNEKTYRDL